MKRMAYSRAKFGSRTAGGSEADSVSTEGPFPLRGRHLPRNSRPDGTGAMPDAHPLH